jgi:hypothetical protein
LWEQVGFVNFGGSKKLNLMDNTATTQQWYDKIWLVILLCILFFPVGIYALWKNKSISKGWKIIVSIIVISLIIISGFSESEESNSNSIRMTQEQEDSIKAEEKKQAELEAIAERKQAELEAIAEREQAELEAIAKKEQEFYEKSLDLKSFFSDYSENEIAADRQYKGNEYIISGKVQNVETFFGSIRIMCIDKSNKYNLDLWTKDEDFAATLKRGDVITVIGICDGAGIGMSLGSYSINMKNCKPW